MNPATSGTPDAYREFLAETLSMASIQAELGAKFARRSATTLERPTLSANSSLIRGRLSTPLATSGR